MAEEVQHTPPLSAQLGYARCAGGGNRQSAAGAQVQARSAYASSGGRQSLESSTMTPLGS